MLAQFLFYFYFIFTPVHLTRQQTRQGEMLALFLFYFYFFFTPIHLTRQQTRQGEMLAQFLFYFYFFFLHQSISSVNKHDREKCLPSFILAVDYKVYDKLYQLAELEEAQITCVLRNLLQLLPTDRDVLEAIDVFSFQV